MAFGNCQVSNDGESVNCDPLAYVKTIPAPLLLSAIALVLALLVPLVCTLCRCFALCCCRNPKRSADTLGCRRMTGKAFSIVFLVLCIAGCIIGTQGTIDIIDRSLIGNVFSTVQKHITTTFQDICTILRYSDGTYPDGINMTDIQQKFDDAMGKVNNASNDAQDQYDMYTKDNVLYVRIGFAIPPCVLFFSLLWVLCNLKCVGSLFVQILLYPFFLPLAIAFTLFMVLHAGVDFACEQVDMEERGVDSPFLNAFVTGKCNKTSLLGKADDEFQKKKADFSQQGCDAIKDICTKQTASYTCGSTNTTCSTPSDVITLLESVRVSPGADPCGGNPPNCDIATCAKKCTDTTTRDLAGNMTHGLDIAYKVNNITTKILDPIRTCSLLIRKYAVPAAAELCQRLRKDTLALETSFGLMYLSFLLMVILNVGWIGAYEEQKSRDDMIPVSLNYLPFGEGAPLDTKFVPNDSYSIEMNKDIYK